MSILQNVHQFEEDSFASCYCILVDIVISLKTVFVSRVSKSCRGQIMSIYTFCTLSRH